MRCLSYMNIIEILRLNEMQCFTQREIGKVWAVQRPLSAKYSHAAEHAALHTMMQKA